MQRSTATLLSRPQQVREALTLLNPPPRERKAYQCHIANALDIMEDATIAHKVFASGRSEAAIMARTKYNNALRRLRAAHDALLAAGGSVPIVLDLARIESAIASTDPQPKSWIRIYGSPVVRHKHKRAVRLAHSLLTGWKRDISISRTGTWHELSAILFGDKRVNLYRHLYEFAKTRRLAKIRRRRK